MLKILSRSKTAVLIATIGAAFAVSACGSSSGDVATSGLAKYVPADALVYVEGSVRPDDQLAGNLNELSTRLTGKSLGKTIDKALADAEAGDVSYEADIKPWLGENAALYAAGDVASKFTGSAASGGTSFGPSKAGKGAAGHEDFGVVADTTDVDASEAFIAKATGNDGGTDGEYGGFSYKVRKDGDSVLGIVDDYVVFATSEDAFKAMVDASQGESLEDTKAFSEVSTKAADGSLLNIYINHETLLAAAKSGRVDATSLFSSLGIDVTGTATLLSLVPAADGISLVGASNLDSTLESGDPSALLETFPANSLFAIGTGDVGANVTKILDAIDKQGIEGIVGPGLLDEELDKISGQGIDVRSIFESLGTVGVFVSGDSVDTLGGALVATTSDPKSLKSTLGALPSLIGFIGDGAKVKPLDGGQTGFSVKVPQLSGRPVVVALQGDRLVVAVGMAAARAALSGKGKTLAGSDAYRAGQESLGKENVDLFGNPAAIANLISKATGRESQAVAFAEVLRKFEYLVGGSGSTDNTFELNLGLKD
ncbi:MAG: DUF3352 domain-containing protein [Solirubrobacterales bacterium]|nr:DUF3352 domain-containing protein [Solirubrobacterales bacterium]